MAPAHRFVLVIDFGGQYSQLIVRRVRECGTYCEMVPWSNAPSALAARRPDAVILSGGPRSVFDKDAPSLDFSLVEGLPILGICYGMQLTAQAFGGSVESTNEREYGSRALDTVKPGSLVAELDSGQVWMSHGTQVTAMPDGFELTATTGSCPIAAFENRGRNVAGVQFHPEVAHTPGGTKLMAAFLRRFAGIEPDWSPADFLAEETEALRSKVGGRRVLVAVSGGVDSSVLAALVTKAIGEHATCVFVDHGLLRKCEAAQVRKMFTETFHPRLVVIDAKVRFLAALKGVTDPEAKRKAIASEFESVFIEHAEEIGDCEYLAQGTLYPDVIESGTSTASKIKTHHNLFLNRWPRERVIEPLRLLFKDEVRNIGRLLGLPAEVVNRQPFPGPGLAVRILGEVTEERLEQTRDADAIFREELSTAGLEPHIWQSYAALLDVRSVGVMGDERTYQHPIVLRAVESDDAMTAKAVKIPYEVLDRVATRIINEVHGVNRVLYDLTSKPPATIEWE